jgi:hypothetical protein
MTSEVLLYLRKVCLSHYKQKRCLRKSGFLEWNRKLTLCGLQRPLRLFLMNIFDSININFHQNWLINECARKKKAKIPELDNFVI